MRNQPARPPKDAHTLIHWGYICERKKSLQQEPPPFPKRRVFQQGNSFGRIESSFVHPMKVANLTGTDLDVEPGRKYAHNCGSQLRIRPTCAHTNAPTCAHPAPQAIEGPEEMPATLDTSAWAAYEPLARRSSILKCAKIVSWISGPPATASEKAPNLFGDSRLAASTDVFDTCGNDARRSTLRSMKKKRQEPKVKALLRKTRTHEVVPEHHSDHTPEPESSACSDAHGDPIQRPRGDAPRAKSYPPARRCPKFLHSRVPTF